MAKKSTKKQTKRKTEPAAQEQPAIRDRIKELRRVPASSLIANDRNWRTHPQSQQDALQGVLAEIGYADALIAREREDGELVLIDGHLRKDTTPDAIVPVLVLDVSEAEADKLLATLDPLAAMASADKDKLDALLRDVQTGSEAVGKMLTELAEQHGAVPQLPTPGAGGDDFDTQAALEGECRVTLGDLWLIDGGKHRLVCGDSTDAVTVERLMGGEKASLIWTDPPYGVDYEGGRNPVSNKPREKLKGDTSGDLYSAFMGIALPHCLPNAPMYVWFAGTVGEPVYAAVDNHGYKVRAMIVWNKIDAHYGNFMAQYMQKHEPCLYCVKESPPWYGPTNEVTVWDVKQPTKNEFHPTQKPVELAHRPLSNSSKQGDIVYDPFLGSGTTLIAAHRLSRRCFGIELEPRYCEIILRRAEAEGLTVERAEA